MHSIISFPFCKPDSDTWEPNAAAGMDQVPKCCSWDGSGPQMLQLGWIRSPKSYIHVSHVTCMHCMLHACTACYMCVLHAAHAYCVSKCYTCGCRLQWEDVTVGQALALTAKPLPSSSEPSHRRSASSSVSDTATHSACCCTPC